MRIICISDTHTFHSHLDIPDGDVLIHAGDFSFHGEEGEVRHFAAWLHSLPHKHKIVIAGNHDVSFEREPEKAREWLGDSCTYLQNSGVTIDGIKIWGSPYHPWFTDKWAFGIKEPEDREKNWKQIPKDTDILVTHAPPYGIFDQNPTGLHLGDMELLAAVTRIQPRAHLFGHIHEGGGGVEKRQYTFFQRHISAKYTTFANVSVVNEQYQIAHEPVIFEI
jgi:Icc-related predicted phosphoesterase